MYSSEDFYRDWRFRINKDFVKPSGSPFEYAKDGLKEWGREAINFPFPPAHKSIVSRSAAISDDGKFLAISAEFVVLVYDIAEYKHTYTLQGHKSEINFIFFRPGHPTQLVTSAQQYMADATPADPEIILWDLTRQTPDKNVGQEDVERVARNTANTIIAELKVEEGSIDFGARDQHMFAKGLEEHIWDLVHRRGKAGTVSLFGRLSGAFQSDVFSPSGKLMCYLPGNAPDGDDDGDENWDLRLYSVDEQKDAVVLPPHKGDIVWTGFNTDETLFGTASWDQTLRVWDVQTGKLRNIWLTDGQCWTGGFSNDGKYFAGTTGEPNLYIYNLSDGSQHMKVDLGTSWYRALSWHPTRPLIAVGGEGYGRVFMVDVEKQQEVQQRVLSTKATKLPKEFKGWNPAASFLEATNVKFVDDGHKLAFFTSGDGSAEVYDIDQHVKWRYARTGTMNPPEDHSPVTSQGGFGMIVYESKDDKKTVLITVDADAVRLWPVPVTE